MGLSKEVSFELAKLLFDKGLALQSKKVYDNGKIKTKPSLGMGTIRDFGERYVYAPTIAEVLDYLLEKHNIWIVVSNTYLNQEKGWCYDIHKIPTGISRLWNKSNNVQNSIKEAYENAVTYCLNEIIK